MKYVTYERDGRVRHGRLEGPVDDPATPVVELGDGDLHGIVSGDAARTPDAASAESGSLVLGELDLRAPLLRPGKLLAAAANYQEHVREAGADDLDKSRISPRLFLKPTTSIGHPGGELELPSISAQTDYEAELCVVIGRRCKDVPVADALGAVFGYMAGNDVSARSLDLGYEREKDDQHVDFFDWLEGKWPDGFAPLGPVLATADEIADPQDLTIGLDVNGEVRQDSSTGAMIFTVAELVAFASTVMTLEPGDVIMTGTPAGVGVTTGTFLAPGDSMTVTIEGLGSLTTTVRQR